MVGSDSGANGCPADSALIRQVKQYMRDWFLGKVIRVADPRFSSADNRRFLLRAPAATSSGRNGAPDPRT
jgi:hypothetical protein